jgi:hypothetical protein
MGTAAGFDGSNVAFDQGFRKPITFLSGLLMYRTFAQKRTNLDGCLSHTLSCFLTYLLYY